MSWLQQVGELSRHEAFNWFRDIAPPEGHEDTELVLAAIDACGAGAMRFAARGLKRDRKFVLDAVSLNGYSLGAAAPELQADRDFVLEAVARDGDVLGEASSELQADHKVVLAAVSQKGTALRFAHPELQADREVLLTAVVQDPKVLQDPRIATSTPWSSNRGFVMAAVRRNGLALASIRPKFQAERDIVLAAVAQNGSALQFAAPWLQADDDVASLAGLGKPDTVGEKMDAWALMNDLQVNDMSDTNGQCQFWGQNVRKEK